jgi:hypothetical protein
MFCKTSEISCNTVRCREGVIKHLHCNLLSHFQQSANVCHGTYISVNLDSKGHGVTRTYESINRL